LGQGTIYPDTIESGGTKKAAVIKTHHNRVPGIQRLVAANRVVEPLASFYKDEVRAIGRGLGLPEEFLERQPFPGPGLAIRCLCGPRNQKLERTADGFLVPLQSVGVQGDSRTYAPLLALDCFPNQGVQERAVELINRLPGINRVIARVETTLPLAEMEVIRGRLVSERLERLRRADAVVRRISHESGFDRAVWQFPVILIPLGSPGAPDSIVLRPVHSVDGMTAQSVLVEEDLLRRMAAELICIDGIAGVFHDLTHKPPGTIEWE
jgi:GMP synthase (glutamine-hydrolysing)